MIRGLSLPLVLGLVACASPRVEESQAVLLDLTAEFAAAAVYHEIDRIDIGTFAARSHLERGWSWNERSPDGTTFAWSSGPSSSLQFFLGTPRPLTLSLRCRPYRQSGKPMQTMTLDLNGQPIGHLQLSSGWRSYELRAPASALRAGVNRLTAEYAWVASGDGPRRRQARRVAVAWDRVSFGGVMGGSPRVDLEQRRIQLPLGSRVDFFFDAPGASTFAIANLQAPAAARGELQVSLLQEGAPEVAIASFRDSGSRLRLPLSNTAGILRLRLQAVALSAEDPGPGFELRGPQVLSPSQSHWPSVAPAAGARPKLAVDRPHVVLYLIDTLRPDHLSIYGYPRPTSPGLQALIEDAVTFDAAIAQSSWTKPSIASLWTGYLPWTHGANDVRDRLPEDLDVLPELLQAAGYSTAAFVTNGFVSERFGFARGFDEFRLLERGAVPADAVQEQALRWLDTMPSGQPLFLYLHTIDPHLPYAPPPPHGELFSTEPTDPGVGSVEFMRALARRAAPPEPTLIRQLVDLYDAEIAFNDSQLAGLMQALRERQLYDDTLIVVVSDHGEEFYEHQGWTHGRTLYAEALNVPLIIKFPRGWGAGLRVSEPVQQIDLLPTLLEALDLPGLPDLPGRSLLTLISAQASTRDRPPRDAEPRPLFSYLRYYGHHGASVTMGSWKLIVERPGALDSEVRLFDRLRDPGELVDLSAQHPVLTGWLASRIRGEMERGRRRSPTETVLLDAATRERLRALGYLD